MVFETLNVRKEGAVLFVEIAAPPMNLLGPELVRDLVSLIQRAEADDAVQVLVFKSADPDYFISHVDVTKIKEYREEAAKLTGEASIALLFRHLSASRLVTIAQIEGRVRGAGSEFVLACDMRFAARESAIFGQPEPAFGVIPGARRRPTPRAPHGPRAGARSHVERGGLRRGAWPNGTAGSTARCPPTRSAISSDRSLIGSPGFRPPAMSRSRTGSMRSRSRRPRISVAIPISSARACETLEAQRRAQAAFEHGFQTSRRGNRPGRGCWATWPTIDRKLWTQVRRAALRGLGRTGSFRAGCGPPTASPTEHYVPHFSTMLPAAYPLILWAVDYVDIEERRYPALSYLRGVDWQLAQALAGSGKDRVNL